MFKLFKKRSLKTINKKEVDKEIAEFKGLGVTDDENDVIISMTSFPERMNDVIYTVFSLLNQTVKPAKVILWLAHDEFPNLEKDIPEKLLKLRENGLTIDWTKNLYSYKKLIPTLNKYPNRTIVTADDDVYYDKKWLEILITNHKNNPESVIAHRAHRIKFSKKGFAPYKKWRKNIKCDKPSFCNFQTGVGGVLYPANCFWKDVLEEGIFNQLAPKADDIWFWAMAILKGTKIMVPKNNLTDLKYLNPEKERGLTGELTLFAYNKKGGNDRQLANILEYYPQIIDIVKTK